MTGSRDLVGTALGKREILSATEFKAKCLELFDRLNARELEQIEVTKRGRVVAVVKGPNLLADALQSLHGWQKGAVTTPPGFDWTAPVLDEPWTDGD